MDKDVVNGKGKDIAGRVERQVGEWTDREDLQAEGAARQVEGKVQKGVGKLKEMGRDVADRADREIHHDQPRDMEEIDKEKKEKKARAA